MPSEDLLQQRNLWIYKEFGFSKSGCRADQSTVHQCLIKCYSAEKLQFNAQAGTCIEIHPLAFLWEWFADAKVCVCACMRFYFILFYCIY